MRGLGTQITPFFHFVLDTEFKFSVIYQYQWVFFGLFGSNLVQNDPKWSKIHYAAKRAKQDYFSTLFEEPSLILY